eukprot:scpid84482/ scgid18809/ 
MAEEFGHPAYNYEGDVPTCIALYKQVYSSMMPNRYYQWRYVYGDKRPFDNGMHIMRKCLRARAQKNPETRAAYVKAYRDHFGVPQEWRAMDNPVWKLRESPPDNWVKTDTLADQ